MQNLLKFKLSTGRIVNISIGINKLEEIKMLDDFIIAENLELSGGCYIVSEAQLTKLRLRVS